MQYRIIEWADILLQNSIKLLQCFDAIDETTVLYIDKPLIVSFN